MSTMQGERTNCLDRPEFALIEVLPYVLLAIATALAVGIDSGDSRTLTVDLAGSATAAVWMLWFLTLHRQWRDRRLLMAVFFIGLVAISAVLVINDPVYGFFSWTGFLWLHEVVQGRLRIVGLVAVAAVTGTSQHGGLPGGTAGSWASWVAIVGLNVFVYSAVGWMMERRDEEYTMRAQMVEDLTEANAKLEASMRENAGLHEQLLAGAREAGVLDERQRMAREIHDTLAQGLVGIITQLEAAAQGGTGAQRHTDTALDLARESLAEARRSVQALAPAQLDEVRLPDALAAVGARWSGLTGVVTRTTTTGTPLAVRPEVEVALLRTGQEALANVAKHARASAVALTLSYMDDVVSLDVRDDGAGFPAANGASAGAPPTATPTVPAPAGANGGFGLTAMRQRIEQLGGELAVESEPGGGTTIAASIPVSAG
jgi:signal transduction histidine kinase